MSDSRNIEVEVVIFYETELAILVSDTGIRKSAVWIPKSKIVDMPDFLDFNKSINIEIPTWLAEEKGFI